ncbi:hypothetical protein N7508_011197 [Penicillium antarcticum]|nr:uncharacterized protein N7508_011197 [Penicillium antarcticum]KAJ5288422.1 hypothetical protein N7508_011197 [Penicillium antarcticum]
MVVTAEIDHDDKGPKTVAALWMLTSLTCLMAAAPVLIRLKMFRGFGIDDYFIIDVMALDFVVMTASVKAAFGKHMFTMRDPMVYHPKDSGDGYAHKSSQP